MSASHESTSGSGSHTRGDSDRHTQKLARLCHVLHPISGSRARPELIQERLYSRWIIRAERLEQPEIVQRGSRRRSRGQEARIGRTRREFWDDHQHAESSTHTRRTEDVLVSIVKPALVGGATDVLAMTDIVTRYGMVEDDIVDQQHARVLSW